MQGYLKIFKELHGTDSQIVYNKVLEEPVLRNGASNFIQVITPQKFFPAFCRSLFKTHAINSITPGNYTDFFLVTTVKFSPGFFQK